MADWHLNEEQARELVSHRWAKDVRLKAVRHLLGGCPRCSQLIRTSLSGEPREARSYENVVGLALWRAASQVDEVVGEALWGELERMPRRRREEFLRRSEDHKTLGVFNAGVRAARRRLQNDRLRGLELAEVLVTLAEYLGLDKPGLQEVRSDRRAEAAVVLSQARRVTGNFAGAKAALETAEAFLEQGTGGLWERAMWLVQQASLLSEVGEFEQAVQVLDGAAPLFRRLGEDRKSVV